MNQVSDTQNFDEMIIEIEWKNNLMGAEFKIKTQNLLNSKELFRQIHSPEKYSRVARVLRTA